MALSSPSIVRRRFAPAALVLLPFILLSCGGGADDAPVFDPAIPVEVAEVQYEARALPIRTSGRLADKAELRLGFKIGGVVLELPVQEGQVVSGGQLLARLDPLEIDAQVAQARIGLDKATRDLDRAESLLRDTVATVEQVENARSARDAAASGTGRRGIQPPLRRNPRARRGRILRRLSEPGELVAPDHPFSSWAGPVAAGSSASRSPTATSFV